MLPMKNGAGGSSVSSFARSLPPTGFSAVSAATTYGTGPFWAPAVGAGGVGLPQPPGPLFPNPVNPSQPLPLPPKTHQHMGGLLPVSAADIQTADMKG